MCSKMLCGSKHEHPGEGFLVRVIFTYAALRDTNARPRSAQACGFGWEIIVGLPWPTGCFAYFDSRKSRRAASL